MAKRNLKERRSASAEEPDLLPLMNILFMLIVAVLTMSALIPLGVVTSETPKLAGGGAIGAAPPKEVQKELNLTIFATAKGFDIQIFEQRVQGAGDVLIPKVQSDAGRVYDFKALHQYLVRIKNAHPNDTRMFFAGDPDVIYDDVIRVIDTAREIEKTDDLPQSVKDRGYLFPDVAFLAGVVK